jgi:hypothetical protein
MVILIKPKCLKPREIPRVVKGNQIPKCIEISFTGQTGWAYSRTSPVLSPDSREVFRILLNLVEIDLLVNFSWNYFTPCLSNISKGGGSLFLDYFFYWSVKTGQTS